MFMLMLVISQEYIIGHQDNNYRKKIKVMISFGDGFVYGEEISILFTNTEVKDSVIFHEKLILMPPNPKFSNTNVYFLVPVGELNTITIVLHNRDIISKQGIVLYNNPIFIDVLIDLKNKLFFQYSDKLIETE